MPELDRVLIHLEDYHRIPIDPAKVFFLEADDDRTLLRTHRRKPIQDVRSLGEIESLFGPHQFLRIHRNHMVNLRKIREIKQRSRRFRERMLEGPQVLAYHSIRGVLQPQA